MKLRTTRAIQALAVTIAAGALPLTAVATSAAGSTSTTGSTTAGTTAYCGITWGSLAKSSARMVQGPVTGVRAWRHTCFDRLVIDVAGRAQVSPSSTSTPSTPRAGARWCHCAVARGSGSWSGLRRIRRPEHPASPLPTAQRS